MRHVDDNVNVGVLFV